VVVKDGYERDHFDDLNPLYLVSVDPVTEQYWARCVCCRRQGRTCCETCSRNCWKKERWWKARRSGELAHLRDGSRRATEAEQEWRQLCDERVDRRIGEVALIAGLTQIVSVFDARILRVLKAVGCAPVVIGRPQRIGTAMAYAALFEPDVARLESLREELEMGPTVLAPGARELVFA